MNKIRSIIFILLTISTMDVVAAELFEYQKPVRAYAMGGVYIPWVEDTDAVFWNPAQLANVESISWQILELKAGANGQEMYELYKSLQASGCVGSACYGSLYGKPLHMSYGGQTSFAMPYFSAASFNYGYLEGTLHSPSFPTLNLNYVNDSGSILGTGVKLGPGLSAGLSVKRILRSGGNQDISVSTLTTANTNMLASFTQSGTGYGFDMAFMYQTPNSSTWKTSIVLDWQDVGSTAFLPNGNAEAPPRIKDNLSFGIGSAVDLTGLDFKVGAEYRHITLQGEQIGKKLHFGTELGLPLIDIQAGLNQGYPTIGTGFDLLFMRFDAASYTEEVGVYPGQSPSARFKISMSIDLSVDANFKFVDRNGKRRKLKQRR